MITSKQKTNGTRNNVPVKTSTLERNSNSRSRNNDVYGSSTPKNKELQSTLLQGMLNQIKLKEVIYEEQDESPVA